MQDIINIPEIQHLNNINNNKYKIDLNNLKIIKKIGQGNFGEVFKVEDVSNNNKQYALKKIRQKLVANFWKNLKNEVKVLAMSDHPNIVKLYAVLLDESEALNLVFELADDKNLFQLLKEQKKITQQEATDLIEDIINAISYLHSLNPPIIHRDLKLENILFFNGILKIIDFGSSSEIFDFRTTFIGTPTYLAPEIIKGLNYTEKVDIWCLGIIFYELIHGYPPFNSTQKGFKAMAELTIKIVNDDIKFDNDINQNVRFVITKMLNKDYNQRPTPTEILEFPLFLKNSLRNSGNQIMNGATNWIQLSSEEKYEVFQKFKNNLFEYKGRKRKLQFNQKNLERKNTFMKKQNDNLKNQILDLEQELQEKVLKIKKQDDKLKEYKKIKSLIKDFHNKIQKKNSQKFLNQKDNQNQTLQQLVDIFSKFDQITIKRQNNGHFLDSSYNSISFSNKNKSVKARRSQHSSRYFGGLKNQKLDDNHKEKFRQLKTSLYNLKVTSTCLKNTQIPKFIKQQNLNHHKQFQL